MARSSLGCARPKCSKGACRLPTASWYHASVQGEQRFAPAGTERLACIRDDRTAMMGGTFVALDAGGSHTRAGLYEGSGRLIAEAEGPGANPVAYGLD